MRPLSQGCFGDSGSFVAAPTKAMCSGQMNCYGYLFRALSFVPLVCVSIFMPVPYLFDDHSFVVSSEIREPDSEAPFSRFLWLFNPSFSRLLWHFRVFCGCSY